MSALRHEVHQGNINVLVLAATGDMAQEFAPPDAWAQALDLADEKILVKISPVLLLPPKQLLDCLNLYFQQELLALQDIWMDGQRSEARRMIDPVAKRGVKAAAQEADHVFEASERSLQLCLRTKHPALRLATLREGGGIPLLPPKAVPGATLSFQSRACVPR